MTQPVQRRWYPIVLGVAALVVLPLSVLVLAWHDINGQIWAHLWATQMPRLLGNTLTLVLEGRKTWRDAGADAAQFVLTAIGVSREEAQSLARGELPALVEGTL